MVNEYAKGVAQYLSDEYESVDFDCKCQRPECTKTLISPILVMGLTLMSKVHPMLIITSGFRCAKHNKEIRGKVDSEHLLGKAADIKCRFATIEELKTTALKIPCFEEGGIGQYNNWLHCDVRGTKARW